MPREPDQHIIIDAAHCMIERDLAVSKQPHRLGQTSSKICNLHVSASTGRPKAVAVYLVKGHSLHPASM